MIYDYKYVLVDKIENVAKVTLNTPPLNLNSIASMTELREVFIKLEKDENFKVIILTGAGNKTFNVGSDLSEFKDLNGRFREDKFKLELDMMNIIEFISKPTIAAIEGYCMGGGLELALCCDIRIMSENTKVAMPEINLGVFPAAGGLYRLPKIISPSKTMEMMYLGESIDAQECLRLNLANKVVPKGEAVDAAMEMANFISTKPSSALKVIKKGIRTMWLKSSEENYYPNLDAIGDSFSGYNGVEGVDAFLAKRDPIFI